VIERILNLAAGLSRGGVAILVVGQLVEKVARHAHW
jgi:hypothetical protein